MRNEYMVGLGYVHPDRPDSGYLPFGPPISASLTGLHTAVSMMMGRILDSGESRIVQFAIFVDKIEEETNG